MNNVTELVIIIDSSGSMHRLKEDVIGGFNALIEEQKKDEGITKVTTIFFNDKVHFVHEGVDIKEIKPLDDKSYCPSGCTALLDAIGEGIALTKAKHAKLSESELPAHTIFSIMTDGLENASKEYRYDQIKEMIELQKKCEWEFLFQAANIDTVREANRLGIDQDKTMSFMATGNGVKECMRFCCASISKVKKGTSH